MVFFMNHKHLFTFSFFPGQFYASKKSSMLFCVDSDLPCLFAEGWRTITLDFLWQFYMQTITLERGCLALLCNVTRLF